MKDRFSQYASSYAQFRPVYPDELIRCICSLVPNKEMAWDCGTGNGQTAMALSKNFKTVYATDISKEQIEAAGKADNIIYAVEPAEHISVADGTIDLVTVSQALHWFDLNQFYREVKRVSKPAGIIAAWTYNLLQTDPITDPLIHQFYRETLGKYWDSERVHVDEGYANIDFPFRKIEAPEFFIRVSWNLAQLEGYLNTWSALQRFVAVHNYNPVLPLIALIKIHWPANEMREICFPVSLKAGYVF